MSTFDSAAVHLRPGGIASAFLPLAVCAALTACGGSGSSNSNAPACSDGTTTSCYSGPAGTEGVGICHGGLQTCTGGAFGACVGEQVPVPETCNNLDDDCNGKVDDGSAAASCPSGVCASGACQPPTCTDHVKNGDETGVDCGGPTCPPCANGVSCILDRDCASQMCFPSVCQADLNGCTPGTATSIVGNANVAFGGTSPGFAYSPPCIMVTAGATVTFTASGSDTFALHPLQGGAILSGVATPATSGPFVSVTNSGTSKAFVLNDAGSFPYYCQIHGVSLGMKGAVFVSP